MKSFKYFHFLQILILVGLSGCSESAADLPISFPLHEELRGELNEDRVVSWMKNNLLVGSSQYFRALVSVSTPSKIRMIPPVHSGNLSAYDVRFDIELALVDPDNDLNRRVVSNIDDKDDLGNSNVFVDVDLDGLPTNYFYQRESTFNSNPREMITRARVSDLNDSDPWSGFSVEGTVVTRFSEDIKSGKAWSRIPRAAGPWDLIGQLRLKTEATGENSYKSHIEMSSSGERSGNLESLIHLNGSYQIFPIRLKQNFGFSGASDSTLEAEIETNLRIGELKDLNGVLTMKWGADSVTVKVISDSLSYNTFDYKYDLNKYTCFYRYSDGIVKMTDEKNNLLEYRYGHFKNEKAVSPRDFPEICYVEVYFNGKLLKRFENEEF